MTNLVNLRMARKRKARAQKEQTASENRAVHGRTGAEKLRDRTQAEKAAAFVDGHRLGRVERDSASARKPIPLFGKHDAQN